MDEMLAKIERIYPNSKYALIPKYNPELFEGKEYDSSMDTKSAMNRWNSNPLTYEKAQEAVESGYRIGWVIPKGYVVIDIDNKDDARSQYYVEKLLKRFEVKYSYNYTSKGIHCLFRDESKSLKSDSRYKCALNIMTDTRANGTGYIILPCNDPHREWGQWNDFVEEVPYFLKPLFKDDTPTFIGMSDGDGRNNALFKWRTKLENNGKLTDKEVEKSIRIINENIFETAIPNNELMKTVLREREKQVNKKDKDNIYNIYADELMGRYDLISYFDNFYMFNGTYYKAVRELDLEQLIHKELNKNISKAGRREIVEFLKIKTQIPIEEFDKDWYKIACKNGILNIVTGELTMPTKTDYNTIYIPYEYVNNEELYSPRIDQFMKDVTGGDPIKMQFLYQIAGYCLLKKNIFEKFFIFQGEGGTGKSTYMNLLHKLVGGDTNCSHVSLSEMDKDYYLATMVSKLLNIDDDVVDTKTLENTGRFKSIISGNIISVRQIYKEVMSFVPYATCVFSCNRLPRIMDKTSGLYRRIILVELNHKVAKPDPLFMNRITDVDMEYLFFKAVEAIRVAMENGHFTINESELELLNKFKRRQSPLSEWIYENDMRLSDFNGKSVQILYNTFKEWCSNYGYNKILSSFSFKEDVCSLYGLEVDMYDENGHLKKAEFIKRGEFDPNYRPF